MVSRQCYTHTVYTLYILYTHIYTYSIIKKFPSHSCGCYVCLPQPRVLYQRPGSLRVLRSILAVPSTAVFWTESSDVVPGIYWSHSFSRGVTAPSAPFTSGTTLAFTFHILQFLFQSLAFLQLLVFLLLDVCCHLEPLCLSPLPPSTACLL